jgi:hypothetical protein
MGKRISTCATLLLLLAGTALACNLLPVSATLQAATAGPTASLSGPTPTAPANARQAPFADYPSIPVNLPASFAGGYSLPVDLTQVTGVGAAKLSAAQLDALSKNGFVASPPKPGQFREFYQVYESLRYESDQPVFATTDAVYHVYHLIFDKMLRDLERDSFSATLKTLTSTLLAASHAQYQQVQGTALEEPARRNVAYFAVAAQLLGLPDEVPSEAADLTSAEVALILAHAGPAVSPIWDRPDLADDKKYREDYSQYVPRGHYTKSEDLQRYFRAMMWYGRMTFRLRDSFETQRALLATQALRTAAAPDGTSAAQLWETIYDPTVFIVGKADDLSFTEYGPLSDSIFGAGAPASAFADSAKIAEFLDAAKSLPPPQVNSMWVWIWEDKTDATKGFRVMGQRFTLDEYVFGQMIWRNVGTQDNPRGLPKALDFFAAMGSEEALSILRAQGEDKYDNFDKQMTKVRGEISALQTDSWTQNLYYSWLYSFQPLLAVKDNRFPIFMQSQSWTRKELQTALGSWTELKHDTILYAKQVMAEMGGGAPDQPPHGYVEPNPEAYARLRALAMMTKSGLSSRKLLSETTGGNLDNLIDLLTFLQTISEKELSGQPISDQEYWKIQYFGGTLEALTLAAADRDAQNPSYKDLSDQKAALVADVATGITKTGDLIVLEEAVGQPIFIFVVLPDSPWRIGIGAIYSYYEFPVAPGDRMTDETWQAQVENGSQPAAPDWTSTFIIG